MDKRQFIGFLHKQNWAVSTDLNLLGLDETSSVAYNSGKTQTCIFFFTFRARETLAKFPQACGKRRETLKSWNAAISNYIQLDFRCVVEKLLIFNICEI